MSKEKYECEDCKHYRIEPHEEPCKSCKEIGNFEYKREREPSWVEEAER